MNGIRDETGEAENRSHRALNIGGLAAFTAT